MDFWVYARTLGTSHDDPGIPGILSIQGSWVYAHTLGTSQDSRDAKYSGILGVCTYSSFTLEARTVLEQFLVNARGTVLHRTVPLETVLVGGPDRSRTVPRTSVNKTEPS